MYLGRNGAGKSTTIKCLLNLIHREEGEILLMGQDNIAHECALKAQIGVVFDECHFHEQLTPQQVEQILRPAYQTWDSALYSDYLDKFSVPKQKKIKELSRGMRTKLSLVAALAHRPKLLLLDEPTAGLDPVVRDEILEAFLNFIQDEQHAILLSSHITTDLEKIADYITYLHGGEVILSGAKDDILAQYGRLACTGEDLAHIDPNDLLRVRRGSFGVQAMVRDRAAFERAYPQFIVEPITLEEIMLFVEKGERV